MTRSKTPIVLVHGLWDEPKVFKYLVEALAKDYPKILTPFLFHSGGRSDLSTLAQNLDYLINQNFGSSTHITLLGFSMGGVVSRIWLQQFGGAKRTMSFFSVGAPHFGTLTAQLVPSWLLRGVAEMRIGSSLLRNLNETLYLLEEVKCTSFFCYCDLMVFPGWNAVLPIGSKYNLPVLTHRGLITHPKSVGIISSAILKGLYH